MSYFAYLLACLPSEGPMKTDDEPRRCGGTGMVAYWDGSAYAGEMCRGCVDCEGVDEELVPHAFTSRTPYEPGDDRDIWCKECEYHRDHAIHAALPALDGIPHE